MQNFQRNVKRFFNIDIKVTVWSGSEIVQTLLFLQACFIWILSFRDNIISMAECFQEETDIRDFSNFNFSQNLMKNNI